MPERILEQIVDVPVPQFMEGTTVPVPLQDETDEVIQLIPAERLSERIVEKIVNAPGPQFQEQTEEVVKITPTEHFVKTASATCRGEDSRCDQGPRSRSAVQSALWRRELRSAPKRRKKQRNGHRKQSMYDSEDELEARQFRINLALLC